MVESIFPMSDGMRDVATHPGVDQKSSTTKQKYNTVFENQKVGLITSFINTTRPSMLLLFSIHS